MHLFPYNSEILQWNINRYNPISPAYYNHFRKLPRVHWSTFSICSQNWRLACFCTHAITAWRRQKRAWMHTIRHAPMCRNFSAIVMCSVKILPIKWKSCKYAVNWNWDFPHWWFLRFCFCFWMTCEWARIRNSLISDYTIILYERVM